ncbi:MAG TPA: amidase [Methylomirabilota bacterium]|nr:amidase [Methylomirabilota bacterium]
MATPDLGWIPAGELAALIRAKRVSPVEVVDAALARIERLNPALNCFAAVTAEEARDAAVAAEVAVMTGEALGPLHGVPVSIKDLVFTRRVPTTGGSRLFADHVPEEDAVCVERLKGAGAIIVGKTTTPEFGHKGVTDSPLFGVTRNPWNPALTPGGSSGGAGAAVGAGLGPLAVGTDGGGSIRVPASFCGIYGLKPSFGRVPQAPGFPGWETFSHTGPMTRTVRDAALMLDVIAGPDDRDRYSLPAAGRSFLAACDEDLAGLSVAWTPDLGYARVDPEVADLCAAAAERFESFGGHVEVVSPSWDDPEEIFRVMAGAETWSVWGERLPSDGEKMDRSLRAFLKFGATVTAAQYLGAQRRRHELWTEVQRFLARFDLLITPTVAVPPFEVGKPGLNEINGQPCSPLGWMPFCFPFNLTGQPAATVPVGFTRGGLPVGLQIVGRRHADHTVLAASAAFEAAQPWADRRPPVD